MDAEDPLFILYTSGSTGKPKGVQHTPAATWSTPPDHKYIFDYHDGDVYWCTADIGWVTGHSYIVYGPLANGATTIMFEGVPTYPDAGRFWDVVDKYKVNQFYTAPTAIRALMARATSGRREARPLQPALLGSVGEPINPEAWMWYHKNVGNEKLPDRRHLVADRDRRHPDHAAAGRHADSSPAPPRCRSSASSRSCSIRERQARSTATASAACSHRRAVARQMRTSTATTTASKRPTSDVPGLLLHRRRLPARRGRLLLDHRPRRRRDQRLRPPHGHRRGRERPRRHPKVAEAAVVGYPHEIKGQGIYAYVTLNAGEEYTDELKKELVKHVRKEIGPIATPGRHPLGARPAEDPLSGKIMRRILRKIAEPGTAPRCC
jgi:acetyl-CoA synthetase